MGEVLYHSVSKEDDSDRLMLPPSPFRGGKTQLQWKRSIQLPAMASVLLGYCALTTTAIVALLAIMLSQLRIQALDNKGLQHEPRFQRVYGMDESYTSLDHQYDNLWDLGITGLVIRLPDENFGGEPKPATISMFHQLHCLASLRQAIQQAREGKDPGVDWHDNDHWPHCMDYLRNTILCWADSILERQFVLPNGTALPFIDGSRDMRQCGDKDGLVQMMRNHGKEVHI
ncbi:hypothetical protein F5884DRAFT_305883 [Xylogone sp. PMI_703]|nr:hypothetical protein F5884DRAFT_305883 [Xylogone sp. PMI_703]